MEEDVIRKQIGVDNTLRQVTRPMGFQMVEFAGDQVAESRGDLIGRRRE